MATADHLLSRLDAIRQAQTAGTLDDAFERGVADFGGLAFAIGVLPGQDAPLLKQERGLERWLDYYHESGLVKSCPFSRRTGRSLVPFTWDEEKDAEAEETYEVSSAAETYGLKHGLHVPVVTREGFHGCVFIQTEQETLTAEARQGLNLMALVAHLRLEEIGARSVKAPDILSPREREVLLWFAEGKSAEDVAAILNIATATVMYHYRIVADRYGTLNRTHTIVQAIRSGALKLD